MNPILATDGYKTSHIKMYPQNITKVYSNYTCRSTKRMPNKVDDIVVFGIQYMCKYINDLWNAEFFKKDKNIVCNEAKEYLCSYLGTEYDISHFEKLHDLGYLPIQIKALPEGCIVKEGIPIFTIVNTHPDFFWVTNFLETLISTIIWKPVHSASIAFAYKKLLLRYAKETDKNNVGFVDFQGHDFSFRGMQSVESAISSGMGFLTSFKGTDTIPALQAVKYYYESINVGFSVPASEHSVMCAHGKEGEIDTLRYLMKQYPNGILSVVSDTWNLWKLITEYLSALKSEIMARDGKLVIRPDSGDPVDIICGRTFVEVDDVNDLYFSDSPSVVYCKKSDLFYETNPYDDGHKTRFNLKRLLPQEIKGVIELLWDIFGGTINEQGYKVLDPHIGAIYGDSITLERAEQICERLKAKGFASTNIVLGIGSYSMGYATRDSQGGAVKSTYVELEEAFLPTPESIEYGIRTIGREIFKDPITDDGTKKSAKGLLCVKEVLVPDELGKLHHSTYKLIDQCTPEEEQGGALSTVFLNGKLVKRFTLDEIRERLSKNHKI